MDIDIKGKLSGLQIAEKIKHLEIPIIFVTSFADDEHFDQAITIPNSTYVTKPVDEYTIKGAIALLLQSSHSIHTTPKSDVTGIKVEGGHLFLKRKEEFYSIEKSDIIYIESSHVYCKTITKSSGEFLNRLTLNEYAALLNDKTFIKPHRSYLINMKNITKVNMNENYIILEEHNVPISRNAKKDLKNILTIIS